ncbi:hypothetical protein [Candidatus Leptofilum sp.]|uniref:hypothetical protein n=1 Tax=Candidatus Leptofilum sp. TaxID=3241576 RepID=UPI003B58DDB1
MSRVEGLEIKWLRWLAILLGVGLVLLWDWAGEPGRPSTLTPITNPLLATDVAQGRLNTVPPAPAGDVQITYRFVAQQNGLHEIELLLARNGDPNPDENGRFTLTLSDTQGNQLTTQSLPTRQLRHNQPFVLRFPVQADSAGRPYQLTLSGSNDNRVTVWGYTVDLLADTGLTLTSGPLRDDVPETAVQELHFTSRYQLAWGDGLRRLGTLLGQYGALMLLALLFLLLPGALLLQLQSLRHKFSDPLAKVGVMLVLGTAVWPITWYLFSLLGGRFSSLLLWILVASGSLLIIYRHLVTRSPRHPFKNLHREHLALAAILLLGLAVRLLAVRDLVFPPWVDSVRHGLITAVMSQSGQTVTQTGYAPFLPIERFPYHYGFHTISSSLVLLGGWEIPHLLLGLGQLLNALLPLTVYAGGWLLTGQRRTGLIAAFLVALPLFFPAYYATWGRYTQLTAMLLMPVLLGLTWRLLRGARGWRSAWWLVALLAVGLFLTHFRVFVFYVPFAGLVWLLSGGRNGRFLWLATGLSILILAPQIFYLFQNSNPGVALAARAPDYTSFPTSYYTAGWDRTFLWMAGGLVLWIYLTGFWRWRVWTALPTALTIWSFLVFLALSGNYLGFAALPLVNLNSYYITTFLPLALVLGSIGSAFWGWLRRQAEPLRLAGILLATVVGTAVTLFGIQQQIGIINPQTILAQPADVAALAWLDENVPEEATVAVNSWLWLLNAWSGSDGGAWLVPLTGRQSSTPPADYTYSKALVEFVRPFNEELTKITDWRDPETAVWLQEQGITHIFIGAKGGQMDPAELLQNPGVTSVYGRNGTFIFELKTATNFAD